MIGCFFLFPIAGTVSVIYLVILVTMKAALLGFHLEFDWTATNVYFVPGKLLKNIYGLFPLNNLID